MALPAEEINPAIDGVADAAGNLRRRFKTGCFVLEGLNALAAAYYFNYLFFYMQKHFGFGNQNNLLLTAVYGFVYMFSAWGAGRLGQKYGYFLFLRLGFAIVFATMVLGALIPKAFGYSHAALFSEVVILVVWTLGLCGTWPMLQALLTRRESPGEASRTAGIYNIIWAVASALAYLTGGALLDRFGGEILFWLAAGIHFIQLALLGPLEKISVAAAPQSQQNAGAETVPPLNPRPIAKARTFLRLGWIANPFAYVAIYGMLPVIPKLSERLGMTPTSAGLVYSVWFWVRLGAFVWFWLWPGWHYRFRWLLARVCGHDRQLRHDPALHPGLAPDRGAGRFRHCGGIDLLFLALLFHGRRRIHRQKRRRSRSGHRPGHHAGTRRRRHRLALVSGADQCGDLEHLRPALPGPAPFFADPFPRLADNII